MVLALSSLIAFILCVININNIIFPYQAIIIMPLIYFVFCVILFRRVQKSSNVAKITIYIYITIQWLRFVALPAMGSVSGYFYDLGSYTSNTSASVAVYLLIAELVVTSFFCFFIIMFSEKQKKKKETQVVKIKGMPEVYIFFIIFSVVLFFLTGADSYTFLAIKPSTTSRFSAEIGDSSIINAIISYGLTFLVILIIYYSSIHYQRTAKKKYMYFALFCSIIRLSLISSEGRLSQIYLLYAFLWILPRLFPRYRKVIIRDVVFTAFVVISLMTIYKVFFVFAYDSYLSAIRSSDYNLYSLSGQIDSYFYSVKTIAKNVEFGNRFNISYFNFIFDLLRNTFGVHYLFKNLDNTTLELYNLYIYSGSKTSGYLFSQVAYGYLYFGPILAPFFTCFNLAIAAWVEKMITYTKYLEVQYILSVIYARLSFSMFSNFSSNWNIVSRTIIIGWIIITIASFIKNPKGSMQSRIYGL